MSCISINNQACKVGLKIVKNNSKESIFFPFSIKISEYSGSSNNINNPYAKLCVLYVTNLNIKLLNLISRTNEARHTKWHKTCKWKGRLDASVCNNEQLWNDDKCRCECK